MRHNLFYLLICCFYMQDACGQLRKTDLLGSWQADHAELTSMSLDTYHFYRTGRFVFNPNAYNGLNRIISIVGRYSINKDSLFLIPDSTEELIGGYPIRSMITTLSDTWEITDGKIKMVVCKKK